ncbi:MAG: hypothetical protein ACOC5T_06730 [Elusimicrobiota bacterium]
MSAKDTANKVEKVIISASKEILRKKKYGIWDNQQINGIIYTHCKIHNCTHLYEYIIKVYKGYNEKYSRKISAFEF